MSEAARRITPADIMPMADYAKVRKERRAALLPTKKLRRIEVGPFATFYFENYATMWLQVHEMLFIEQGGAAQIEDELRAYNPLIPQGHELIATMMLEIDDPIRRTNVLARLGGVEGHIFLDIGGKRIMAVPADDVERTTPDGKTSAVHFMHFPIDAEARRRLLDPSLTAILGIDHPNYGHMALLSTASREELAKDLT
ncbi:MAG: DUF3501 family protein [Alphaproteobacteria bacterium]|nr:DUF3501 family protein [Alphaproteobacteria bacterium]